MRGQAFVSFADKEVAAKAAREVRGFPLYSKPMVSVFVSSGDGLRLIFGRKQISFAKTRSDAVVKKLDPESVESHLATRKAHKGLLVFHLNSNMISSESKAATRYSNPLKRKFAAKRMAADGSFFSYFFIFIPQISSSIVDGAGAAPISKRPNVMMPDEYLPPNKILFLQNLPESVTKDQLMALFTQCATLSSFPSEANE